MVGLQLQSEGEKGNSWHVVEPSSGVVPPSSLEGPMGGHLRSWGGCGSFPAPIAKGCGGCEPEPSCRSGQCNHVLRKWEAGSLTITQPL